MFRLIQPATGSALVFATIDDARAALAACADDTAFVVYSQEMIDRANDTGHITTEVSAIGRRRTRVYRVMIRPEDDITTSRIVAACSADDAVELIRGEYPENTFFDAWISE